MSLCNTPVEPCYFARRVRAFFCLFSGKAAIGIELDWIGLDWIGLDWIKVYLQNIWGDERFALIHE